MIDVQNLVFSYPKASEPTLHGLTFHIEPGEIFGFLGPSGAGKSTTQKILIGLLRGFAGQVRVLGRDLNDWGGELYERVGISFEFPNHFLKLTGRENLSYFARLYAGATLPATTVLDLVGLSDAADLRVSQYSKGMKARLSVARALLHQAELLFLDEPTAGLDPVSARRIRDLIQDQRSAGHTVFLSTHDMAVADALCDRVAFIVDGQIAAIDAPRAFRLRYGAPMVRVEHRREGRLEVADFDLAGLGENAAFLELLQGGEVQTLHTQEASLEDVFIRVTGRRLA